MPTLKADRWSAVAMRFGAAVPVDRLHPGVRDLVGPAGPGGRGRWVLACSGGSDSLALVLAVWAHWPRKRGQLVLAHFDHRLRGRASTADARFCARLAAGLGIRCEIGRWESAPVAPSEAVARAARQAFLEKVCRRHRARLIWTGHQQNDVAETLLMRLARGSGTAGLAAPRPVQPSPDGRWRVRPLLDLSREVLQAALRTAGAAWREDASNASGKHFRNRLRAGVLPAWQEAAGRDAMAGAALSRTRLEEDAEALDCWLAELAPIAADGSLQLRTLAGKPVAVWRRALHAWLGRQDDPGDLSRAGFDALLTLAQEGGPRRFSLGRRGFVRIRHGRLFFEKLSA